MPASSFNVGTRRRKGCCKLSAQIDKMRNNIFLAKISRLQCAINFLADKNVSSLTYIELDTGNGCAMVYTTETSKG